jgi:hypothetical protein
MNDKKISATHELANYLVEFLPKDSSDQTKQIVKNQIIGRLLDYSEKRLDKFCELHNLCPICIRGGWNCGSDHK